MNAAGLSLSLQWREALPRRRRKHSPNTPPVGCPGPRMRFGIAVPDGSGALNDGRYSPTLPTINRRRTAMIENCFRLTRRCRETRGTRSLHDANGNRHLCEGLRNARYFELLVLNS